MSCKQLTDSIMELLKCTYKVPHQTQTIAIISMYLIYLVAQDHSAHST